MMLECVHPLQNKSRRKLMVNSHLMSNIIAWCSGFHVAKCYRALFIVVLICALGPGASILCGQTYLEQVGVPPFSAKVPVENGWINPATGNLHLEIPLGSYTQRGSSANRIVLMYDGALWYLDPNVGYYQPW